MRRGRLSSLRARLVVGQLAGVSVFLALSGVAIYWIVRGRMLAEIDRSLVELARSNLPPLVREIGLRPPLDPSRPRLDRRPIAEGERGAREPDERPEGALPGLGDREDLLFQSWRPDGRPGARSRRLGERVLPRIAERVEQHAFEALDEKRLAFAFLELEPALDAEGRTWRAVGGIFRPPAFALAQGGPARAQRDPPSIEAVFAKDVSGLVETLTSLRWLLVLGWLGSSLGCWAPSPWPSWPSSPPNAYAR